MARYEFVPRLSSWTILKDRSIHTAFPSNRSSSRATPYLNALPSINPMEESKLASAAPHSEAPPPSEPVPHTETIPDVPDPDEDDLDDLDDLLDQFSANSISASGPGRPTPKSSASAPALPTTKDVPKDTIPLDSQFGGDFSSELQKEMAALLGEIDNSPEMRQQLDMLMGEFTSSAEQVVKEQDNKHSSTAAGDTSKDIPVSSTDAAFTDTIKRTMERMAASGQQASAAATSSSNSEDDMLASLLKEFAASGGGDGAPDEDFSKMLLGMMEQLTNKEVLYEPMKELYDKFPAWIIEHEGKDSVEDMVRYKEQNDLVREIVGRFDKPGYKDENAEDREYIVERMQKVCTTLLKYAIANVKNRCKL